MPLKSTLIGQFSHPRGLLGRVAGFIMANRQSNRERNEWTLSLLSLRPDDVVLEIGFGPGYAIAKAAENIVTGMIIGIDHSATMLAQASSHNADAIQQQKVQLRQASADNLPVFEHRFNKIYSVNSVMFWQDPVAVFKALRDLLAPEGVIATTYMPRLPGASTRDAEIMAETVSKQLKLAGFADVWSEINPLKPVPAVCVLAKKHGS